MNAITTIILLAILFACSPCNAASDEKQVPELHRLATKGNIEEMKRLIDSGIPPDQERDPFFGATALLFAADAKTTRFLLSHGADPKARSNDNMSALMEAARNGDIDQAKILIQKGLIINDKDDYGRTSLHFSIGNMKPEFTDFLLTSGAYVDAQDSNGETALMKAMQYAELDQVKVLLKHNANTRLKDSKGMTALDRLNTPNPSADLENISEIRELIKKAQQADAPNSHAFGTFVTDPADAGSAPKASGSR
jgi:Ankyrin repeats (3 copies)